MPHYTSQAIAFAQRFAAHRSWSLEKRFAKTCHHRLGPGEVVKKSKEQRRFR